MTDLQVKTTPIFYVAEVEKWRPVPGYEGEYEASSAGRIRSVERIDRAGHRRKERVLKPGSHPKGYRLATLMTDNGGRAYGVHVLVALAFHGPPPTPQHEVNHKDGIKWNNRPDNLEWTTPSENVQHAYRVLGHTQRGEKNNNAVMTETQVTEARRRYTGKRGEVAALAREFGVPYPTLYAALAGRTWGHL